MSRFVLFLTLIIFSMPLLACAVSPQEELKSVVNSLRMSFPNIPVKQISTTPVEGLYEVVAENDDILYFAPLSGYLLVGEMWNNSGQNLTRASKARLMTEKLSMFPLDKAIKIGDGPNQAARRVEYLQPDVPGSGKLV